MKKLITLMLSLLAMSAHAQSLVYQDSLNETEFRRILNDQFTLLVTGQSNYTVGSFASLKIDKPNVTFSPSFILNDDEITKILKLTASGGISDGIFELGRNEKFNPGLSFEGRLQFMNKNKKGNSITYDAFQWRTYNEKVAALKDKYILDSLNIRNDERLTNIKKQEVNDKLDSLRNERKKPGISQGRNDSLTYIIEKIKIDSASIDRKLGIIQKSIKYNPPPSGNPTRYELWENESLAILHLKYADEYEKLQAENLDIYGFKFAWWSAAYKINYNSFKLFDPDLNFSEQVSDGEFVGHELNVQYSLYNWSSDSFTYFFSGGLTYQLTNNLDDLKSVEVKEETDYGPVDDLVRTRSKSYNAYIGDYEKNIHRGIINGEAYLFPLRQRMGIHLYPSIRIGGDFIFSSGIGFLLPFKEKTDKSSIVNAELYYNFIDVFLATKGDEELYKKNNFGLRFSFPINFNPN